MCRLLTLYHCRPEAFPYGCSYFETCNEISVDSFSSFKVVQVRLQYGYVTRLSLKVQPFRRHFVSLFHPLAVAYPATNFG